MIEYFYTGYCPLSQQETLPMLKFAFEWEVTPLKESCGLKMWEDEMTTKNQDYRFLLDIAQKYGCISLEHNCAGALAYEFNEMLEQSMIFDISPSTWQALLKQDHLCVESEQVLFGKTSLSQKYKDMTYQRKLLSLFVLLELVLFNLY